MFRAPLNPNMSDIWIFEILWWKKNILRSLVLIWPTLLHSLSSSGKMLYIIARYFLFLLILSGSALVIRLGGFASILMYAVLYSSHANPSLTNGYAIELLFFFKFESSIVVFQRNYWLSPYTNTGFLTGMPIILSFYLRPCRYTQQIFIATNSLPKKLVLTDVCFFDSQ